MKPSLRAAVGTAAVSLLVLAAAPPAGAPTRILVQVHDLQQQPLHRSRHWPAVKADAVASLVLHWRKVFARDHGPEAAGPSSEETQLEWVVSRCGEQVENLLSMVEPLLAAHRRTNGGTPGEGGHRGRERGQAAPPREGPRSGWDNDALRQLEWAIHNARADLYLYSVMPEAGARLPDHERYLEKARVALRKCEMLLPPGVETLSNLGSLYLRREGPGDLVEARRCLNEAIELNPYYEYAYYRLAQCWEKEQWREKVIAVLRSFNRPVRLREFRAMYDKYHVPPAEE